MKLELSILDDNNPAANRKQELPFASGLLVIGRGPESPVQFEGTRMSRQHLGFSVSGGALLVTDLSSTGAWINDKAMPKNTPVLLDPADEIRIPGYRLFAVAKPSEDLTATVVAKSGEKPAAPAAHKPAVVVPPGPPLWRLQGYERWALFLVGASLALVLYYRWL